MLKLVEFFNPSQLITSLSNLQLGDKFDLSRQHGDFTSRTDYLLLVDVMCFSDALTYVVFKTNTNVVN